MALEAFSLAIAPLPGVTVPNGAPASLYERADGTFAVRWISQYLDQLTPDQKQVVDAALQPGPDAPSVTSVTARLAWADTLIGAITTPSDYLDEAETAEKAIAGELGRPLSMTYTVTVEKTQNGDALAYAGPGGDRCIISVEPALAGESDAVKAASMAHEMFHCFELDCVANTVSPGTAFPTGS